MEVAKAKEVLRDAQEMFKKAQGVQKEVREDVKRVKENAKEPGIHDQIKGVNNDAESDQPHPCLTQLSKGKKMNTYQVLKANHKTQMKHNDCMGIYSFRSDDIFKFRSEDDLMPDNDLDSTKSTEMVGGSGIGKKVGASGLARSGERREQGDAWKEEQVTATVDHCVTK